MPTFELLTTNGAISLISGSRIAYWNGLGVWLGYSPQFIKDDLFLHLIDAQKTLFPLLSPPALKLKTNAVIVLDPGHGGKDPGTMSGYENHYEKEYALDWALRLQKLLFNHGWRVYLTRTNDADLSLAQRVSLAERWQADLFISLHFNSAPSTPEAAGLETYCLTPTGMPSSVTRADDGLGLVFPNNAFDDLNLQYAARLHRALVEATKADDRMIRRARFLGVLRGQNRPAVLLEGGYLSNPQEAQRIADPRYRQKLSQAVAQALRGD